MPLDRCEAVLTDPTNASLVDTVLRRTERGLRAASHEGSVEFRRGDDGIEILAESGRHPLRNTTTNQRLSLADERSGAEARLGTHATPLAFESVAQFFDSRHAPDAVVLHAPGHRFHGNTGEHGTLGVTQARAPFIAAGPGIASHGTVDTHLRSVDVAPTLAALLGAPEIDGIDGLGRPRSGVRLRVQDGDVRDDLLDPASRPDHVVVFLWDGVNPNTLRDEVARGGAPRTAALMAAGTDYGHGCLAALPTATLANHMTANTGVWPGRSGVLHNTWFDRDDARVVDLLDLPQMVDARRHLRPDLETLHECVHRIDPEALTVATFEYADRGAGWSTYGVLHGGGPRPDVGPDDRRRHRTDDFVDDPEYRAKSTYDTHSRIQAEWIWRGGLGALPRFSWFTFNLTDAAGHAGGPASDMARAAIRDTDARMGDVLDTIEAAGALDRTAVVVMADHGMQHIAESEAVDLSPILTDAGVDHTLVDGQFVYLD